MADDSPWEAVQKINRAWRTGEISDVGELFHPDAVIVHPGFEGRTEGREACLQSYRDFAAQATVRRLDEYDPQVDVTGDTAVISYGFQIDYEMDGETYADAGRDVFVLTRAGGRWQAIWRTLVMDG
jgi:uncharacterized protein (TIGR02246 family)